MSRWEDAAIRRLIIKQQTCTETLLWPENMADCSEIPPSLTKKKKKCGESSNYLQKLLPLMDSGNEEEGREGP